MNEIVETLSEFIGETWSWGSFWLGGFVSCMIMFILLDIFGWNGKK